MTTPHARALQLLTETGLVFPVRDLVRGPESRSRTNAEAAQRALDVLDEHDLLVVPAAEHCITSKACRQASVDRDRADTELTAVRRQLTAARMERDALIAEARLTRGQAAQEQLEKTARDLRLAEMRATNWEAYAGDVARQLNHKVQEVTAERDELQKRVAGYENGICWDTTCLGCAKLLDRCYAADARRDAADKKIAAVLGLHRQGEVEKWVPCEEHLTYFAKQSYCGMCAERPVQVCEECKQPWPCRTAQALQGGSDGV
ncbi:hypothetical protein ACIBH1_45375 [Nonomuraea sp. NPDC050663]|uniref:hypothetical protein n=1 Tax=Nonomuraea sp. NPDC050663 TaxID=3364370 RepID=UPI00379311B6